MIRITKKCEKCGDVTFWQRDEFHCKGCNFKEWEPFHLLLHEIRMAVIEDKITLPEGVG